MLCSEVRRITDSFRTTKTVCANAKAKPCQAYENWTELDESAELKPYLKKLKEHCLSLLEFCQMTTLIDLHVLVQQNSFPIQSILSTLYFSIRVSWLHQEHINWILKPQTKCCTLHTEDLPKIYECHYHFQHPILPKNRCYLGLECK